MSWPTRWATPTDYCTRVALRQPLRLGLGYHERGWDCFPRIRLYGCIGVHTIGYNKDLLDWIPPARKYTAPPLSNQTIALEDLAAPAVGAGSYLWPRSRSGLVDRLLTVEARKSVGYDQDCPPRRWSSTRSTPRVTARRRWSTPTTTATRTTPAPCGYLARR